MVFHLCENIKHSGTGRMRDRPTLFGKHAALYLNHLDAKIIGTSPHLVNGSETTIIPTTLGNNANRNRDHCFYLSL